jgi:hypothetical protein
VLATHLFAKSLANLAVVDVLVDRQPSNQKAYSINASAKECRMK